MSQALKVLANFSVTNTVSKYGFNRLLCFGKDLAKPSLTAGADFLLQNLKNAPTPKNVLKIVNEHYNIMNSKHIMQALRSIFDLQKLGSSDVSTKDILRHPDFDRLCKKLKSQSGVIELNETIEALKVLTYVGVPSNSLIVQVLLQLLRQNINSLSLNHIIFLDFLISHFKSSPLVDALKIALPLVFEIHLPIKMDTDSVAHLSEYMHYASRANLSEATVDKIVKALYHFNEEFDAKTSKTVIWSITDMAPSEIYEPLINKAINDLILNTDDLKFTDLESTISRLIRRYTRRYPYFYNEVLLDTYANYVIDHDLGFQSGIYALRKLGRVAHASKYLLDYVSKKAYENPDCIVHADPAEIYSITISAALTNYRPPDWDNVRQLIINKKDLAAENRKEIIWIRFAASLCLLDIYKIDVLTRALNPEYLKTILNKGYMSDYENFFAIWQSIQLNKPEFVDVLPSKCEPMTLIQQMKELPDFPIEASLHKGFGGEQYVMSNLFSKKGHQIDHAVIFRKGGYPVSISKEVTFVEDIELQDGNELLLILVLRPIQFTINTKVLREAVSLSIKALEVDGYNVVTVNLEVWESLNDFEKIPYLMQLINHKVDGEILIETAV